MIIAVLIKQVPDTYEDRHLQLDTGIVDREATKPVVDEINERALEFAVAHAEQRPGTEVVAVTMGPSAAQTALRSALAIGADRAVHVVDPQLTGADAQLTSRVLAAALRRVEPDLVLAGNQSTDGGGGVLPAMLAERLGVPHLTGLDELSVGEGSVSGTRVTEQGRWSIEADLPAVASVTDTFPDARFPSFKGISAAKKKPIEEVSLAELGVEIDETAHPQSILLSVAPRPPREAGVKIDDQGDAGRQIAEFLAQKNLV